jgi:hypothetical protein
MMPEQYNIIESAEMGLNALELRFVRDSSQYFLPNRTDHCDAMTENKLPQLVSNAFVWLLAPKYQRPYARIHQYFHRDFRAAL